jgi:hypothetical protein
MSGAGGTMKAASGRGLGARLLREPLLHFLLIGAAIFVLYRALAPAVPAGAPQVISVTPAQVERLAGQFEAVWRRPPTDGELAGLVEDFVREEIYYREALALGLDRDDTVIRRRLRQKMEFFGDAGAGALVPDDAELRAHFTRHLARFTPPARITFRQVFLGEADPATAQATLAEGSDPETLGQATLLPRIMEAAAPGTVDGTFGGGFFAAISGLEPGEWRGPIESGFGSHLVQFVEMEPAVPPSFEAARGAVEEDWRRETAERRREAQFQALRERYEVVMPPAGP